MQLSNINKNLTWHLFIILFSTKWIFCKNLTIGLFVPWTGSWPVGKNLASAATVVINDIKNDPNLLKNYTLSIAWKDCMCNAQQSVGETANFNNEVFNGKKGVDVYIGPYCTDGCQPSGLLAAFFKKPMISYSCSGTDLSDKKLYPTFARTIMQARSSPGTFIEKFGLVMDEFRWNRITLIVSRKAAWTSLGQEVFEKLYSSGKTVQFKYTYDDENPDFHDILVKGKRNARSKFLLTLKKFLIIE